MGKNGLSNFHIYILLDSVIAPNLIDNRFEFEYQQSIDVRVRLFAELGQVNNFIPGRDMHNGISEKLKKLLEKLTTLINVTWKTMNPDLCYLEPSRAPTMELSCFYSLTIFAKKVIRRSSTGS